MDKRETVYGAPDPPDILIVKGVIHPSTLPHETEEVIRQVILSGGAPFSMFEIYRALVERGVMKPDPEAALYREHPTIKQIAGACQHLYFSGQLADLDGAPA